MAPDDPEGELLVADSLFVELAVVDLVVSDVDDDVDVPDAAVSDDDDRESVR